MIDTVRIALVGVGSVADFHHVPAIRLDPRAELVAICDENPTLLAHRSEAWQVPKATTKHEDIVADPEVDAVIIATPNYTHKPIALACLGAGKHVMCEKPLGLNFAEAAEMYRAARDAKVRHMTAFTYRFAPAMRFLKHLVSSGSLGTPRHFRSQRFLDWPETSWGWRQYKKTAGAGDLYDMTIHRIDFAQDLLGAIAAVSGALAQFARRDRREDGRACDPSDVDDWSAILGQFESGATGVWEGSTLMKGYHNEGLGYEWAEVNGSEGTAVYRLGQPNTVLVGKHGESLTEEPVPDAFLAPPGSPRDPSLGVPSVVFRYDLVYEFVSAIVEGRRAVPGFDAGARAQAVADAVIESFNKKRWVKVRARLD